MKMKQQIRIVVLSAAGACPLMDAKSQHGDVLKEHHRARFHRAL